MAEEPGATLDSAAGILRDALKTWFAVAPPPATAGRREQRGDFYKRCSELVDEPVQWDWFKNAGDFRNFERTLAKGSLARTLERLRSRTRLTPTPGADLNALIDALALNRTPTNQLVNDIALAIDGLIPPRPIRSSTASRERTPSPDEETAVDTRVAERVARHIQRADERAARVEETRAAHAAGTPPAAAASVNPPASRAAPTTFGGEPTASIPYVPYTYFPDRPRPTTAAQNPPAPVSGAGTSLPVISPAPPAIPAYVEEGAGASLPAAAGAAPAVPPAYEEAFQPAQFETASPEQFPGAFALPPLSAPLPPPLSPMHALPSSPTTSVQVSPTGSPIVPPAYEEARTTAPTASISPARSRGGTGTPPITPPQSAQQERAEATDLDSAYNESVSDSQSGEATRTSPRRRESAASMSPASMRREFEEVRAMVEELMPSTEPDEEIVTRGMGDVNFSTAPAPRAPRPREDPEPEVGASRRARRPVAAASGQAQVVAPETRTVTLHAHGNPMAPAARVGDWQTHRARQWLEASDAAGMYPHDVADAVEVPGWDVHAEPRTDGWPNAFDSANNDFLIARQQLNKANTAWLRVLEGLHGVVESLDDNQHEAGAKGEQYRAAAIQATQTRFGVGSPEDLLVRNLITPEEYLFRVLYDKAIWNQRSALRLREGAMRDVITICGASIRDSVRGILREKAHVRAADLESAVEEIIDAFDLGASKCERGEGTLVTGPVGEAEPAPERLTAAQARERNRALRQFYEQVPEFKVSADDAKTGAAGSAARYARRRQ